MASNVSTIDGMGFEEVNQASYTEVISGDQLYGRWMQCTTFLGGAISGDQVHCDLVDTNQWVSGPTIIGNNISGTNIRVGGEGTLHSVSIDNATAIYGQKIKIGSVLMGDDISGLIVFKSPFASANYMVFATAQEYGAPQWSSTGSQSSYCVSGTKATGSCFIVGGSATVVGWMAVGI